MEDKVLEGLKDQVTINTRRLEVHSLFLFGHTLNGEGPMSVDFTSESWCGRTTKSIDRIKQVEDKLDDLKSRVNWQTAVIVGAGAVINVAIMIWNHYAK